ncbi:Flp family type IVb pilin [Vibrio mediterranei]|jgi:pilus assembly protein Flp/PilA|uniref:Flp family type IVb pilin n=1 Tax=Vibrio mediterranei TaxID=689 RepID=A0ABX5D9N9_9VIBR|nr:Flp family type IVb pilin [Vibrio mediterranei]MCG9658721.1 Flp family type IVb pilin [Vibrio mediterranei]MCG9661736.1 Flp family type IVb pilin [Vibrio mediterranei]NOI25322.1 Flp family type IVb pilin [Vibrio mediterranei]PCD86894.1 Flp family type IVb pilin [Vibrio mediterranei]PRQ66334.1 Flp family type IVb pilin [Vibrio mediterranei]
MITKLYVKTGLFLSQFKNDQRGVTAIEYGLIGVAMAVALSVALSTSGSDGFINELKLAFTKIGDTIETSTK